MSRRKKNWIGFSSPWVHPTVPGKLLRSDLTAKWGSNHRHHRSEHSDWLNTNVATLSLSLAYSLHCTLQLKHSQSPKIRFIHFSTICSSFGMFWMNRSSRKEAFFMSWSSSCCYAHCTSLSQSYGNQCTMRNCAYCDDYWVVCFQVEISYNSYRLISCEAQQSNCSHKSVNV